MPESPESVPAIVVTGATGNVGRAVVHALLQSGLAVRALVTDPASATLDAALPANGLACFVRFDFADPATFAIEKQLMRMAAEYASEMKSLYQQGMAVPRSLTRATSGRPSPLRSRMQTVVPTPIARLN